MGILIKDLQSQMSGVHLAVSSVRGRHTEGIHMQAKTEGSLEFVVAEESIRQIVRWEDDLYPTSKLRGQRMDNTMFTITYTALKRTAVDIITTKLADSHCSILVGVHLHKSKTTV